MFYIVFRFDIMVPSNGGIMFLYFVEFVEGMAVNIVADSFDALLEILYQLYENLVISDIKSVEL